MGLRDRQQGDRQQIVMRLDVAENSVDSIPPADDFNPSAFTRKMHAQAILPSNSAISTISMPDSSRTQTPSDAGEARPQKYAADCAVMMRTMPSGSGACQENRRILKGKKVSRTGIEPPQSHYSRKVAMCEESGRLRPDRPCGVFQARLPSVAPTAYTYAPIG